MIPPLSPSHSRGPSCLSLWGILGGILCLASGCRPAPVSPLHQALKGSGPFEIEILGSEDRWLVRYPGQSTPVETSGGELLGLEVHVPENRLIRLSLQSADYVYTLELPRWQLKEIAVPRLVFAMEFDSGPPSRSPLVGDHLCRGVVEELRGTLIVEPVGQLVEWLESQPPPGTPERPQSPTPVSAFLYHN